MRSLFIVICAVLFLSTASCTKVLVYAGDYKTPAVSQRFAGDAQAAFFRASKALEALGYTVQTADQYQYHIMTGWRSIPSGGFYKSLFNRRDYSAASGAYYQVIVDVVPEGNFARVDFQTNVKSIAGELSSAGRVEKAFFKLFNDMTRSPQIEITNVGVSNK